MRALPLLALLLLTTAAASAQGRPRIAAQNDRAVVEALRGLGVPAAGPGVGVFAAEAFAALYPNERYDRYPLSPVQAFAVAHVTLVFAAQRAFGGGLPGYPAPVEPACTDATERLYDLSAQLPRGSNLFLTDAERRFVREAAPLIRRSATACGCVALAESALELQRLAGETMVRRSDVTQRLDAMRHEAHACR